MLAADVLHSGQISSAPKKANFISWSKINDMFPMIVIMGNKTQFFN